MTTTDTDARCWMKTSEEWQATAEEWEKRALAAESRPLTPDAIDNAMTDRMLNEAAAMRAARIQIKIDRLDAIRLLTAALTEPPVRPEGADFWDSVIADQVAGDLTPEAIQKLADTIALKITENGA